MRESVTNPYEPPSAPLGRKARALHIAEIRMLATWWRIVIVGGLGGGFIGGLLGATLGGFGQRSRESALALEPWISIVSFIIGLAISYMAFRYFVKQLFIETVESNEGGGAV
jgi:hypothetical protein